MFEARSRVLEVVKGVEVPGLNGGEWMVTTGQEIGEVERETEGASVKEL
jgi:hypothetical protein